jgi:hypothetical protein
MSKNKIEIDVKVDDNGTTTKLALDSKKAAAGLDGVAKNAGTADRNMKGAAQASSNSTKNFSKMAQGMGGLVGVYATVAAQAFAVTAAFDFLKRSMDFKNLIEGQKALGSITGVAYQTISNSLVEATNGQLKYAEAAKAAAIGTASGISPTQLARLGSAAKNASIALGRDLGDSFDRLIRGVTKAEPELLDELGIILRLENATNKYGLKIGKAAKDLNEFERSQAVANEVLEQAERKFGAMEKMMDPTSAALNQFSKAFDDVVNQIKMGIAGPLAGIATFLSENILALIGSLSLFAAGILKQILPSMSAWKASSVEAGAYAMNDQKKLRAEIDKTKASYVALQKAQNTGISKTSTESLGGMKGSKAGTGAVDFLSGSTDSKAAQNAANKALTNAENQLKDSAKKRTGIFKHMNAAQVADLRASYDARAAIIKKGEVQFKLSATGMKLSWKSFVLSIRAGAATIKIAFATIASAAATLGTILSKAFFYLSMIAIAYDVFKLIKGKIFPVSEATQTLNKDTDALIDKYKTLSEEIGRTNGVMNEYVKLTTKERIVARGNAAASLDVEQFVKDINSLDKRAENFEDAKSNLLKTAEAAVELDSGFQLLFDTLKSDGKITDKQAEYVLNLSNRLQAAKFGLEQLTAANDATSAAFVKLVGSFSKPFGTDLLSALTTEIKLVEKATQDYGAEVEALKVKQNEAYLNKDFTTLDSVNRALKEAEASQKASNNNLYVLNKFYSALKEKQVEINQLINDQTNAEKLAADKRTKGITYADKRNNLEAEGLILAKSANDEKVALLLLQTKQGVLLEKQADVSRGLTDDEVSTLENLVREIGLQQDRFDIADANRKVAEAQNKIAIGTLDLQHELNKAMEKRLALSSAITEAERKLAFIKAGGTGSFGFARGKEAAEAERSILYKKRREAAADVTSTQNTYNTQKTRYEAGKIDLAAMTQATQQKNAAADRMASIDDEITLFDRRAESVLLNSKAETELLRATYEGMSLNPAVTEFNKQIVDLRSRGIELSRVQEESLYAEIEAQTMLQQSMQMKQDLFNSLTSNITSAFTSIIDGTKSAKQAFGDMAIAILADITRMVIQMMIMRVLMQAFGPSFTASDAGMTDFAAMNDFSGTARYGGVFDIGGKLPGYATGGIARGAQGGYPVELHGTEAVVPLPNGKSIPVEMSGTNQNNNVVVNVSIDDKGNSTSNTKSQTSMDAGKLGSAVAKAVQEELQNQKRSGGILNPYGAA